MSYGKFPIVFVLALCGLALVGNAQTPITPATPGAAVRRGFREPPKVAKLRTYWWWLNGNTDEATITNDLTEMSRKGFAGVLLVDANGSDQHDSNPIAAGPLFGSPAWVKLYVHALKTAAALHMEVTLNILSGWNVGGPDVTPEDSTKLLTWSRVEVRASGFDGELPMPATKNGFYRQIAVLAYPLAHGAGLAGTDGRAGIRELEFKNASTEMNYSMPKTESLLEDAPAVAGEQDTDVASVVDISAKVDGKGHVRWRPAASGGQVWEILRIGYTDSDARVSTSSGAWQGRVIDYLDRGAFDRFWEHTVAPLLEVGRPYLKTTLVNLATDSWEVGGTNWTGRFRAEFERRRGYDPVRYLPVVTGRIVGDRATSTRFLDDLRRTVGDLITDHYDHFAERAAAYGLGVQAESGGPHGGPLDGLETFRRSAVPQTEFWGQSNEHRSTDEDRFFVKEAASAADIYGKKYVAAEGFTSIGPQWSESLAKDLKPSFDQALTEGLNRLVWHEFTSSPKRFGLPGIEYFAGTHLNPNGTWWQQGGDFFRYLNRSQWMMQQGHAVDDVLYFYGDEVPNFARLKKDDPARVLPGYDYDVTDEDALLRTLKVGSGAIATPAGNRYRLLMLPQGRRLSLASLERIASYVRQGGSVAGEVPLGPTGIVDAAAGARFSELTREVWGGCAGASHAYGKGMVYCSGDGRAVLREMGVAADFEDPTGKLDYVHRRDGAGPGARDIYFVRNKSAQAVDAMAAFRVAGRTPELWSAVDGSVVPQSYYVESDGRTRVPLHLEGFGSVFVVFERKAGVHVTGVIADGKAGDVEVSGDPVSGLLVRNAAAGEYRLRLSDGREVTAKVPEVGTVELPANQWTIAYQADRGAPSGTHPLGEFTSWSLAKDVGIRYFSGTAIYRTDFAVKRVVGERVFLVLTDLHEVATVKVNGKAMGTMWAMPYRMDITDGLKDGTNQLELDVTDLWANRIIGDLQPGVAQRFTWTNIKKYRAETPLLDSGVVGPVRLEMVREDGVRVK